jgi:uncharacterized membrane protein
LKSFSGGPHRTDQCAGSRLACWYLVVVTVVALLLIAGNAALALAIPFKVEFLIGYLGALLVFVVWHSVIVRGPGETLLLIAVTLLVAFVSEAFGVNFGLVFGDYHYTEVLGAKLLGVPVLAAVAWGPITYAGNHVVDLIVPTRAVLEGNWIKSVSTRMWVSSVGALAITGWDMMIDPIAVSEGWWVWQDGGPYVPYVANGVPITNFAGWLGVSFLTSLAYRALASTRKPRASQPSAVGLAPLVLYSSLFATAAGVAVTVLQRPEISLVGLLAMGPFIAIASANLSVIRGDASAEPASVWVESRLAPQPVETGERPVEVAR